MKKVVILVGPSGIGKTTWAKANLPDHEYRGLDADGKEHMNLYRRALEFGADKIVVDNTGRDRAMRSEYIRLARIHGYFVKAVVFEFDDIQTVLQRSEERERAAGRKMSAQVAAVMYFLSTYQPVGADEVDEIQTVPLT